MNGLLLVVKPPGLTSHDVVAFVRRETGEKTGHTGTLDPAAAGLLVVALGSATRLSRYLTAHDKTYRAEITLGLATDTGDAEGEVTARGDTDGVTEAAVRVALAELTGTVLLPVPAFSAVKQEGKPLHRRQRAGEDLTPPEREMHVHTWELLELRAGPPPAAMTELSCAAGTYVRSLATALGERLHTPAYLSFLVRTRIGRFHLAQAHTLEEIAAAGARNAVGELLLSGAEGLCDLPAFAASAEQAGLVRNGGAVVMPAEALIGGALGATLAELACIVDERGELLAVARVSPRPEGYLLWPETVVSGEFRR